MRRITLALALVGAVTAAGCSGGATSTSGGGSPGVTENTFKVTIQNGQDGNTSLAITGGWVTSVPAGIDCGVAPHSACTFDFPAGTAVTLTATAVSPSVFYGFAGDCHTTGVCSFTGYYADKYVVAQFGPAGNGTGHPNWDPNADSTVHSAQATTLLSSVPFSNAVPFYAFACGNCHGGGLAGVGLAPGCDDCHGGSATPPSPVDPLAPDAVAAGETCTECHANQGAIHQATYNKYADTSILTATIDWVQSSLVTTTGRYIVTARIALRRNGASYTPAVGITALPQKTVYVTAYDAATRQYLPTTSLSVFTAGTTGTFTVRNSDAAPPAGGMPTNRALIDYTATSSMAYAYFAENPTLIPPEKNYKLYDNVASAGLKIGTWTQNYESSVSANSCSRCHGTPYLKHGYRAGLVNNLEDMAACKACHYDNRPGGHADWQCLAEDPAAYAAGTCATKPEWASYAYTANVMNDTHMSHAMEFAYPQDMANCTTCHSTQAKLDIALTDANFTTTTCKSCHPITTTHPDAKRAPPLNDFAVAPGVTNFGVLPDHHDIDRATGMVGGRACNECHQDNVDCAPFLLIPGNNCTNTLDDDLGPTMWGNYVPLFPQIHSGFNPVIYASPTLKYSAAFVGAISSMSYTAATNVLSATVTVTESPDVAGIDLSTAWPVVYWAPYGYDTKDFILAYVSVNTDPASTIGAAYTRSCTVASNVKTCTVTADLDLISPTVGTGWTSRIANGAIERLEVAMRPTVKTTFAGDTAATTLATNMVTGTFDLAGASIASPALIVDPNKCNACHEALATTFHSPDRGGSVVGCRVCHQVTSAGSHLPEQSRSIDSYVHAIHTFQPFDPADIDVSDPVEWLHYEHHIESSYPYFTRLACESCHLAGRYNPPTEAGSLPGILSASEALIPNVAPQVVTGPAARACGGCHRAEYIIAGDGSSLDAFIEHTRAFGYRESAVAPQTSTDVLNSIIDRLYCDTSEDCVP